MANHLYWAVVSPSILQRTIGILRNKIIIHTTLCSAWKVTLPQNWNRVEDQDAKQVEEDVNKWYLQGIMEAFPRGCQGGKQASRRCPNVRSQEEWVARLDLNETNAD